MKKQIPNLVTLLNLICGCIAIVMVLQNGIALRTTAEGSELMDVTERIWMASFFIGLAAVVDFLDGFVARLLKATSPLGGQLDSLSDVVSFGVAPSMILYQFLRLGYAASADAFDASLWWLLPAFIPAAAAAYRLGRFNLENNGSVWFQGLPTPAAGLLTASLPLIYWNTSSAAISAALTNPLYLIIYSLLLSWLMISKMPMMSMKFEKGSSPDNLARIILLSLVAPTGWLLGWLAVPAVFVSYIILSLVFKKHAL